MRNMPLLAAACACVGGLALAEDDARKPQPMVREIFVPFEDLHVVLENQPRRMLLSRQEYEDLLRAARTHPDAPVPCAAAILSAEYTVSIQDDRAELTGALVVDVLDDGLQTVALDLAGVGLREAVLDDVAAPIGVGADGRMLLFVAGAGHHALRLQLVAPLQTSAAEQVLSLRLPTPAATTLSIAAPGDVDIKSGAELISRQVDSTTGTTHFTVLPQRGDLSMVFTLNSRLKQDQRVVVARSVAVSEVTTTYERLHATFSMAVLHKAVDRFRFAVPAGFDITDVRSPEMARWGIVAGTEDVLEVWLREPTTAPVVLTLAAVRQAPFTSTWVFPRIEALDVQGHVAVVGLMIEERLQAADIRAAGLIPINTSVITEALPPSVLDVDAGAPRIRPIVAYYAPQSRFDLAAHFTAPAARLLVTTNLLLNVAEDGLTLRGGFSLLPEREPLFATAFSVPAGWQVTRVAAEDGSELAVERYAERDGALRARVQLPRSVAAGQQVRLYVEARHVPQEWLGDWTSRSTPFPAFSVIDATRESGAIAVSAGDDLTVVPGSVDRLTPLDEREKAGYGLGGVPTVLAYRFDDLPYRAGVTVHRDRPRITAQTYSFFVISPGVLRTHSELHYDVEAARTRQLVLLLPETTPQECSIRALDGVALEEYTSETVGNQRRWTIRLAERHLGRVRLAVDFEQPLASAESERLALPVVRADGVDYQSGFIAVEGSAELDVQVTSSLRRVDIGELVEAQYHPGKRLLGTYGFVAEAPIVSIDVVRHAAVALPAVIVERNEMVTVVSANGITQTAARFQLRTKAQLLELNLPDGSTLWSAEIDGVPVRPQREDQRLLLSLPLDDPNALHDLRVVYETPADAFVFVGDVVVPGPRLTLRDNQDASGRVVPVADLVWEVYLPTGYRAVDTGGTVDADQAAVPDLAVWRLARWLADHGGSLPTLARARVAARESPAAVATRSEFEDDDGSGTVTYYWMPPKTAAADRARADSLDDELQRPQAPPATPAPEPTATPARQAARQSWALQGVQSLRIDLQEIGAAMTFRSLGDDPRLAMTLIDRARLAWLAAAVALAVVVLGCTLIGRSTRTQVRYVGGVALTTTVLPLVTGSAMLTPLLNSAFYAAVVLIPIYIVAGAVRRLRLPKRSAALARAVPAALALAALFTAPQPAVADDGGAPLVIQVVEPPQPVDVPHDAILLPYDPQSPAGRIGADQLLVPYDRFVALWNLAHPQDHIRDTPPPAPYALAGAVFDAVLAGTDFLDVRGVLTLDVYADGHVTIPLALDGGVLTRAELDGRAATVQLVHAGTASNDAAVPRIPLESAEQGLMVLVASGQARHRLDLTIRFPLQRFGGWHAARGRLPVAPATRLTLQVPHAQTEVRLSGVLDRRNHVTATPGEAITTALALDGALSVQWRPKVSQTVIDHSLTVQSTTVFDVQEDGLRWACDLDLAFRNGERDFFTFTAPGDYLVVDISGGNVRGWVTRPLDGDQELHVTLLKPARDSEHIRMRFYRQGVVGQPDLSTFDVPGLTVDGAALHAGQITLRQSPLLELRTAGARGVTRADLNAGIATGHEPSPLGIRPYQAYTFSAAPYVLSLAATPVASRAVADVHTILRIARRQRRIETRADLDVRDRRIHTVRLLLPGDLQLDEVLAPGAFEWAVSQQGDRQLLSIYLGSGQIGQVPIVVRATFGDQAMAGPIGLPAIEVLDVDQQHGQIVVQADPALQVRATDLTHCETILVSQVSGWLNAEQRALTRLAIAYRSTQYGGLLQLSELASNIRCHTVSNIRVTDRTVEETMLLDFNVRDAGLREITFLLPERLKDARINVPMLRQKTVEAAPERSAEWVRVRLELQDAIMGQLRVLVEHDHLLSAGIHHAPLPIVESGRTTQRYVLLERAGRGEIVIASQEGVEPLSRLQKQWGVLAEMLGGAITKAYVVDPDAPAPQLSFEVTDRATVETVAARIGLAQSILVLDGHGAYRAVQLYRLNNRTEQFLEVEMPPGADLWTARVAGEPVKPVSRAGSTGRLFIPLVKTAAGDLDYEVTLKFGGTLPEPGRLAAVDFPFVRALNINVELSQASLFLPDTHAWFDFDGTMRRVLDEAELAAGYVSYQNRMAERLGQVLGGEQSLAKVRAGQSLEMLRTEIDAYRGTALSLGANALLQNELDSNDAILREANVQLQELEARLMTEDPLDNRGNLNSYYDKQVVARANDVVQDNPLNFIATLDAPSEEDAEGVQFDSDWLAQNALKNVDDRRQDAGDKDDVRARIVEDATKHLREIAVPDRAGRRGQPEAPQVAQVQRAADLEMPADGQLLQKKEKRSRRTPRGERELVQQYQLRLQEQTEDTVGAPLLDFVSPGDSVDPRHADEAGLRDRSAGLPAASSGLASLDIEIPRRGTVYRFTTPRGETRVTARAVAVSSLRTVKQLGLVVLVVLVIWRLSRVHWTNRTLASVLLVAGMISIVSNTALLMGLVALVVGVAVALRVVQIGAASGHPHRTFALTRRTWWGGSREEPEA